MFAKIEIIGRIVKIDYMENEEELETYIELTVSVKNMIKNKDGKYETDFFKVKTKGEIADKVEAVMHVGDLIALNAKVTTKKINFDEDTYYYQNIMTANHIVKLANKLY